MNTQAIRIWDVFVIGPLMIYAATRCRRMNEPVRTALLVFGIGTIAYNGVNYLRGQNALQ